MLVQHVWQESDETFKARSCSTAVLSARRQEMPRKLRQHGQEGQRVQPWKYTAKSSTTTWKFIRANEMELLIRVKFADWIISHFTMLRVG